MSCENDIYKRVESEEESNQRTAEITSNQARDIEANIVGQVYAALRGMAAGGLFLLMKDLRGPTEIKDMYPVLFSTILSLLAHNLLPLRKFSK